jgi:hypothetical protein
MNIHNINCDTTDIDFDEIDIDKALKDGKLMTADQMFEELSKPLPFYKEIYYFVFRKIRKIKDTYYDIKYAFQRAFRGYDDTEVFDLPSGFLTKYTKILKDFKKCGNSYPVEFESYDDWIKVIDEMICYFELSDEFNPVYDYDEEYCFKKSFYNERLAYYYRRKALDMFVKYFDDLWD